MNKSIKPGEHWLDTSGNPIQAHGASIIEVEGNYYLYGENKEKTYVDSEYWYNGVNCYKSNDLMNWEFSGVILPPNKDMESPLHHTKKCDRPHILYNKKTGMFVMWIKVMGDEPQAEGDFDANNRQFMCIATSDKITGPFEFIKKVYPLGMYSGDFDMHADPVDGKGYIIFERPHTEMIICDLTEDYLDVTGYYSAHFPHVGPIETREAPCLFKRNGLFYLLTSGTSGYFPNPSEVAKANLIHGPWAVLGDPCVEDDYKDSFNCQFSSVFKVPNRNLYIALGDRWMYGTPIEYAAQGKMNTALARYVWLPIKWEDDTPRIEWLEEWKIEDYPLETKVDPIQEMRIKMAPLIPSILKRKEEENL